MFETSVIEKKHKRRIDLVFDDTELSQQQVQLDAFGSDVESSSSWCCGTTSSTLQ